MHIGTLVVVGVGLIGGSCALALRRAKAVDQIIGVGRGRPNLDAALSRGIVDVAYALDDDWTAEIANADVVLIATPVAQYPTLLASIAPAVRRDTIVTDAGSTKQNVVAASRSAFRNRLNRFVPAHPIAGSEQSGALAADASLFVGRNVVLTPIAETDADAVAQVDAMWSACGARVTTMSPSAHDHVLAAVSHLPHMLAFAFVAELADRPDGAALLANAGSGFRDFTRIAASSAEMWRDIALANRHALLFELERFRSAFDRIAMLIERGDGAALTALFERAAAARRSLSAPPSDDDPSR